MDLTQNDRLNQLWEAILYQRNIYDFYGEQFQKDIKRLLMEENKKHSVAVYVCQCFRGDGLQECNLRTMKEKDL